jgi:hypothetical protein
MCAMGGPVYVSYGWTCICMIWVTLYMCGMGGPVYVCYRWTCICVLWVALYMYAIGGPVLVRDSCRLTALIKLLVAVQRQRVLYTETIEFASPAIG